MGDHAERPPDYDIGLIATWRAGRALADDEVNAIWRDAPIEPDDEPCVYWDDKNPQLLLVEIGISGNDLDSAARRGISHLRLVLRTHDAEGTMIEANVMSETHCLRFLEADLREWADDE